MTTTQSQAGLLLAERALQAAQLAGDVAALDLLLDDRLVAIGPDGARHTKSDDLAGSRSGFSVITELVEEDVEVLFAGTTGVTFVTAAVSGVFGGEPLSARLRTPVRGRMTVRQVGESSRPTLPCCHRQADSHSCVTSPRDGLPHDPHAVARSRVYV